MLLDLEKGVSVRWRRMTRTSVLILGAIASLSCATSPALTAVSLGSYRPAQPLPAPSLAGKISVDVQGNRNLPSSPGRTTIPLLADIESFLPQQAFLVPAGAVVEQALQDNIVGSSEPIGRAPLELLVTIASFQMAGQGVGEELVVCTLAVEAQIRDARGVVIERFLVDAAATSPFDRKTTPDALWEAAYEIGRELRRELDRSPKVLAAVDLTPASPSRISISAPERVSNPTVVVVLSGALGKPGQRVQIRVNGKLIDLSSEVQTPRGTSFSDQVSVPLEMGDNTVTADLTDASGQIARDTIRIVRSGERARTLDGPRKAGYRKRVAVAIGINQYRSWPRLEGARGDAERVGALLRKQGFDDVLQLFDQNATRQKMLELLGEELPRKVGPDDLVVIYFAGHGQTESLPNGDRRGYLIPVDGDQSSVFSTAISMATLRDLRNRMSAKHVYYVMDSCFSGLGFSRGSPPAGNGSGFIDKMTSTPSVQMIAGGQENEQSFEKDGSGIFTSYLLRALQGEADSNRDGYVTHSEIAAFVRPGVTDASEGKQTPQAGTLDGLGEIVFKWR